MNRIAACLGLLLVSAPTPVAVGEPAPLELVAQARDEAGRVVRESLHLRPDKTAVVVVDMWDRHWCETYTARVAALAPRMNQTLDALRALGVQVVFAPSDVVDFCWWGRFAGRSAGGQRLLVSPGRADSNG